MLKAIEDGEDEGEKALFSLMLKNALILAVKGNGLLLMHKLSLIHLDTICLLD